MTRRTPLLALALTLALAALAPACTDDDGPTTTGGGGGGGDDRPDSGTLVDGEAYRGVLLDADLDHLQTADGSVVEDDVESFVPTEDEVAAFEAKLPAALPEATNPNLEEVAPDDLAGYVRQYTGVASGSEEQLVVAGFCNGDEMDWQDGWIQVSDGGTCFWDATMDLTSGEIVRFAFNGSA